MAVVGGGPVGAVSAREAARAGANTLLVEKRDGSGEPARCAGLVSPRVLPAAGASDRSVIRKIRGGLIHSPSGSALGLRSSEVKGLVIDRPALDRELMNSACDAGVEVRLRTQAISARSGHMLIATSRGRQDISASVIIGADGPTSAVASWFSLSPPQEALIASQATVLKQARKEDEVDIFFGRSLAPTFFAWVIPAQEGTLRVGLGAPIGTDTNCLLSRFLEKEGVEHEIERVHGLIPISLARETVADGVLLVGDAAGQVKPSSGGGLYTGLLCAKIAGQVAAKAALAGRTTKSDLAIYEQRFKAEIGDEISFGQAARSLLCDIDDQGIDTIMKAIDRKEIKDLISSYGDIDYPSQVAHAIASRRDLWPAVRPLISTLGGMEKLTGIARMVLAGDTDV